MSMLEQLQQFSEEYTLKYETQTTLKFAAHFCKLCYPPSPLNKLTPAFRNFWFWFNNYCFAVTYTRYTVTIFNIFINIFKDEPATENIVSHRITDFAHRLVGSLKYTTLLPIKLLVYYLINLSIRTTYFTNTITEVDFRGLQPTINSSLTDPVLQQAFQLHFRQYFLLDNLEEENNNEINMDQGALRNLLTAVLGENGLNIRELLDRTPTPREQSLVKVEPFKGTDQEDPYEWMEAFEQAAAANNWSTHRLPDSYFL
jgi:hypothetical protein